MTTLEGRVDVLDEVLTREKELAASRDRDLADMKVMLRSHTAMLQGLNERQSQQSATLQSHTAMLQSHTEILHSHTEQISQMRAEFQAGHQTLVGMLTTLINRE
ncbi:hypothetical protein [Kineosporia babensis]|uniref:Uncharacterized protein n=1 Tax=Kineosporia babensis TaxID=499548 RepID=A0A9X1NKU0_9ACTN|nr:hypothetical protein [Kineosporia babensis]MCD5315006.1 hypothetical protein [Kineosporia babensis]